MTKKYNQSTQFYRDIVEEFGVEAVRAEQERITGKKISTATVNRYASGYETGIPANAYEAARSLMMKNFDASRTNARHVFYVECGNASPEQIKSAIEKVRSSK